MIQATLREANAKVRCGGSTSESFPVGVGLRQGDGPSVSLFNIVLEWIIRQLIRPEDMKRTALTNSFQLLAYADDTALIARGLPDLKKFFIQLARAAKEIGLEVKRGRLTTTSSVSVPTTIWENWCRRQMMRPQQLRRES
jgi:hypothetical protein